MRALCPSCGFHHEVVRVLDDLSDEGPREVYQLAPFESCERVWLSTGEAFQAAARFDQDALLEDDEAG